MKHNEHRKHSCELIQLSISDAIDTNQRLQHRDKKHIESCPECAKFYQIWRQDSSLTTIASGSVSEQLNLFQAIPLKEHNIIRGKFIKVASIAAMIAVICVGALNFSETEAPQSNITQTQIPEKPLSIKMPAIAITLSDEKIEKVLEKNYQSLSKSASKKWKTATTGIAIATEYIATSTHQLSSKYLAPSNHGASGPHSRVTPQPTAPDHPQYG